MNRQKIHEKNLIVVAAVEEYSLRHHMPVKDVLLLFDKYKINDLLRSQYETLHTIDFSESADFAESFLKGASL